MQQLHAGKRVPQACCDHRVRLLQRRSVVPLRRRNHLDAAQHRHRFVCAVLRPSLHSSPHHRQALKGQQRILLHAVQLQNHNVEAGLGRRWLLPAPHARVLLQAVQEQVRGRGTARPLEEGVEGSPQVGPPARQRHAHTPAASEARRVLRPPRRRLPHAGHGAGLRLHGGGGSRRPPPRVPRPDGQRGDQEGRLRVERCAPLHDAHDAPELRGVHRHAGLARRRDHLVLQRLRQRVEPPRRSRGRRLRRLPCPHPRRLGAGSRRACGRAASSRRHAVREGEGLVNHTLEEGVGGDEGQQGREPCWLLRGGVEHDDLRRRAVRHAALQTHVGHPHRGQRHPRPCLRTLLPLLLH
eukprot:Rhum_TRINITY_DN14264_c29_g1::Rhum_TRINITY_DN14264_c29_g1_i1::g.76595::m.76595